MSPPPPPTGRRWRTTLAVLWGASVGYLLLRALQPEVDTGPPVGPTGGSRELVESLSPLEPPAPSPSNRVADDPGAARLGQRLFFDARLSGNGEVSCATCHRPELGFTDGQRTGLGIERVARNTPTVVGTHALRFLNWDGSKDSLWSQALGPIEHPAEMGGDRADVARLLRTEYRGEYEAVFGPLPGEPEEGAVTRIFTNVGKALAAYQRRLVPGPSDLDRYVAALRAGDPTGGDHLSPAALRGLRAFVGHAGCVNCHAGPWLSDSGFHALHVSPRDEGRREEGRRAGLAALLADPFRIDGAWADEPQERGYRFLDPNLPADLGALKTPTLRNVTLTAPYGHAGQFATLREVLEFYRSLRDRPDALRGDPLLAKVSPAFDVEDMLAFLRALESPLEDPRWSTDPGRGTGSRD